MQIHKKLFLEMHKKYHKNNIKMVEYFFIVDAKNHIQDNYEKLVK